MKHDLNYLTIAHITLGVLTGTVMAVWLEPTLLKAGALFMLYVILMVAASKTK